MINIAKKHNEYDDIRFNFGDVAELDNQGKYDIIISTHAMPYFRDMKDTMQMFYNLLNKGGIFCMAQAACNNKYDKFVLTLLEVISSEAKYPSTDIIQKWIKEIGFTNTELKYIKENKLMPTIFALCCRKD